MININDLYASQGITPTDGALEWARSVYGDTVDPNELANFQSVAAGWQPNPGAAAPLPTQPEYTAPVQSNQTQASPDYSADQFYQTYMGRPASATEQNWINQSYGGSIDMAELGNLWGIMNPKTSPTNSGLMTFDSSGALNNTLTPGTQGTATVNATNAPMGSGLSGTTPYVPQQQTTQQQRSNPYLPSQLNDRFGINFGGPISANNGSQLTNPYGLGGQAQNFGGFNGGLLNPMSNYSWAQPQNNMTTTQGPQQQQSIFGRNYTQGMQNPYGRVRGLMGM